MHRILPSSLALLLAVLFTHASTHSSRESSRAMPMNILWPIRISEYEATNGLQRRSSNDFSSLDLQTQSELIYGSPGDAGRLLLANMTLYAPDGLLMIMMEHFEGITSSVDCAGDEGTMSLTFSSQDAFNYALKEWSFINEHDDERFLLIANYNGCGPDYQRQPYLISKITESTAARTTHLTAKAAPWWVALS